MKNKLIINVYTKIVFACDAKKTGINFLKHEISFEEAISVFIDPEGLHIEDREHSTIEVKYIRLAKSTSGKTLVVVYTFRRVMKKKQFELSVRGGRPVKREKLMGRTKIDFSDMLELTDPELSTARRVGRPNMDHPKELIAFRIDPDLLFRLRKLALKKNKPYQTLLHEIIEKAVKKAA